jgi:hypothetical protein
MEICHHRHIDPAKRVAAICTYAGAFGLIVKKFRLVKAMRKRMDLKAIRDHLYLAGLALGPEHPLSSRIKAVERNLTPCDPLWCNDAVSAETDLLAISTELERLPKVIPPCDGLGVERISEQIQAEVPPGVNEAVKQIADAIALL